MRQKKNGSYTVEGAFVVPVILGMAFLILCTLFIVHDKAVLQANLDNLIFLLVEDEFEGEEYNEFLSQGLWFTTLETVNIKNGKLTVRGKVKGASHMKIPVFSEWIKEKQEVSLTESYYKVQPELVIRFGKSAVPVLRPAKN